MVKLFSDEWIEENCAEYRPLNMRMRREMTMGRMNVKPPRNLATFISSIPMSDKQKEVMLIRGRAMTSRANLDRDVRNISRDPVVNPRENFSLLQPRLAPVSGKRIDMELEKQVELMKIVGNSIRNLGIRLEDPQLLMMEGGELPSLFERDVMDELEAGERPQPVDMRFVSDRPLARLPPPVGEIPQMVITDPRFVSDRPLARLPAQFQRGFVSQPPLPPPIPDLPPPTPPPPETNIVRTAMETGIGTDIVPIPALPIDEAPAEVKTSLRATIRERYTPQDMETTRVRQNRLARAYEEALDVKTEILMNEAILGAGAEIAREEFVASADSQQRIIDSLMTLGKPDADKIERLNSEQLRNAKGVIMRHLHIKTPELEQLRMRPQTSERDKLIIEISAMIDPSALRRMSPTYGGGNLKQASDRRIRRFDNQFDKIARDEYRENLNAILGRDEVNRIVGLMDNQANINERINDLENEGFSREDAEDIVRREIEGVEQEAEIGGEILDEYLFEPDADGEVEFENILREAFREEELEQRE